MNYLQYDLGILDHGQLVEVTLRGTEANVFLVDSANLAAYRAGRQFRYFGRHTRQSPVLLTTPHHGYWHAVVDMGGRAGAVNASVRVLGGVAAGF